MPFSNGFETPVQQGVLTFLLGALSADLPSCPKAPPGHKGSTCSISGCDSALSDAAYPLTVYAQEAHKRPAMRSPYLSNSPQDTLTLDYLGMASLTNLLLMV